MSPRRQRWLAILVAVVLAGPVTAAHSADDIAAAQAVISAQAEAFGRDDAASAYSYAAPAIKDTFPDAGVSWRWSAVLFAMNR